MELLQFSEFSLRQKICRNLLMNVLQLMVDVPLKRKLAISNSHLQNSNLKRVFYRCELLTPRARGVAKRSVAGIQPRVAMGYGAEPHITITQGDAALLGLWAAAHFSFLLAR